MYCKSLTKSTVAYVSRGYNKKIHELPFLSGKQFEVKCCYNSNSYYDCHQHAMDQREQTDEELNHVTQLFAWDLQHTAEMRAFSMFLN